MERFEEEITFNDWFESKGYSEEHKEQFKVVWNASLYSACAGFGNIEGTDHGTQDRLEA